MQIVTISVKMSSLYFISVQDEVQFIVTWKQEHPIANHRPIYIINFPYSVLQVPDRFILISTARAPQRVQT